jgi:hypothetical protein
LGLHNVELEYPSWPNIMYAAMKSGNHVSCPTVLADPANTDEFAMAVVSPYARINAVVSVIATPAAEVLPVTVQRPVTGHVAAVSNGQAGLWLGPAGTQVLVLMVLSVPALYRRDMSVFSMIVCVWTRPALMNECFVPAAFTWRGQLNLYKVL